MRNDAETQLSENLINDFEYKLLDNKPDDIVE